MRNEDKGFIVVCLVYYGSISVRRAYVYVVARLSDHTIMPSYQLFHSKSDPSPGRTTCFSSNVVLLESRAPANLKRFGN